MDKKKSKNIGIIIGIVLFLGVIGGITYAWLTFTTNNILVSGNTHCFTINYSKGADIAGNIGAIREEEYVTGNTIKLSTAMGFTPISLELAKRCSKVSGIANVELNVNSLSEAFTSEGNSYGSLKYVLAEYDPSSYTDSTIQYLKNETFTYVRRGIISGTGTMNIHTEYLEPGEVHNYLVIVYIDKNLVGDDIIGANVTATVTAEADQFVATPITEFTYATGTYNGITIPEGKILLVSYDGTSPLVNVDSTYTVNGVTYETMVYSDTNSNTSTFGGNMTITNVNFANGVSFYEYDGTDLIENSADSLFKGCTSLVEAPKLSNNITSMNNTYEGCTSLENVEYLPSSLQYMNACFSGCTSLEGYVVISSNVVNGWENEVDNPFYGTSNNIIVVTTMSSDTYNNFNESLPPNVTLEGLGPVITGVTPLSDFLYVIGEGNNTEITSIPIYACNECLSSGDDSGGDSGPIKGGGASTKSVNYDVGSEAFKTGGIAKPLGQEDDSTCTKEVINYTVSDLYLEENQILLTGYTGDSTNINIPDTYTVDGVTYEVVILSTMGTNFNSAGELTPSEPLDPGGGAYSAYDLYDTIVFPLGYTNNKYGSRLLEAMDDYHYSCTEYGLLNYNPTVETISIGENVVAASIWDQLYINDMSAAFYNDISLVSVTSIPSSTEYMNGTFSDCTSLVDAPEIPNSVTEMSNTFENCTSLIGTVRINSCSEPNLSGTFFGTAQNITVEFPSDSETAEYLTELNDWFSEDYGNVTAVTFESNSCSSSSGDSER